MLERIQCTNLGPALTVAGYTLEDLRLAEKLEIDFICEVLRDNGATGPEIERFRSAVAGLSMAGSASEEELS